LVDEFINKRHAATRVSRAQHCARRAMPCLQAYVARASCRAGARACREKARCRALYALPQASGAALRAAMHSAYAARPCRVYAALRVTPCAPRVAAPQRLRVFSSDGLLLFLPSLPPEAKKKSHRQDRQEEVRTQQWWRGRHEGSSETNSMRRRRPGQQAARQERARGTGCARNKRFVVREMSAVYTEATAAREVREPTAAQRVAGIYITCQHHAQAREGMCAGGEGRLPRQDRQKAGSEAARSVAKARARRA